jgi:hypothetical protein
VPRLSRWLIRIALLYLVAGFALGTALLAAKAEIRVPGIAVLLPLHVEFVLIGGMLQLVMGVAFWVLPRHRHGSERGPEGPVAAALGLLNAGVVGVGLGITGGVGLLAAAGRACELAAVLCLLANLWPRVKAFGAAPDAGPAG